MIQEIFPHVLNNSFQPREPERNDRALIFRNNSVLVVNDDEGKDIPTFSRMSFYWPDIKNFATYLFSIDGEGFFLVDESSSDVHLPKDFSLENILLFREMQPQYLAFAGITGHQLYKWYNENRFCGRCGKMMVNSEQERARVCPCCNYITYPHISPAIIVAVSDGKRLLMAKNRQGSYKPYSLIAGFVEFGESFEDTVRREVFEEVGIQVKNIRYYKSQPWAFSCTEMIGFLADLDGDDTLTVDDVELTDAQWFKGEDIPENLTNLSIAQDMIEYMRARLTAANEE